MGQKNDFNKIFNYDYAKEFLSRKGALQLTEEEMKILRFANENNVVGIVKEQWSENPVDYEALANTCRYVF